MTAVSSLPNVRLTKFRDRGVLGLNLGQRCDGAGMKVDDIAKKLFQRVDAMAGLAAGHAAVRCRARRPGCRS